VRIFLYSTTRFCVYICTPYVMFLGGIFHDLLPYGPLLCSVNQVCVGCENIVCILLHGIVFYILSPYVMCSVEYHPRLAVTSWIPVICQPNMYRVSECRLYSTTWYVYWNKTQDISSIFSHPTWCVVVGCIHDLPPHSPLLCFIYRVWEFLVYSTMGWLRLVRSLKL